MGRLEETLGGFGEPHRKGISPEDEAPGPPFPKEALWRATEHLRERADGIGAAGVLRYAGCYRSPAGGGECRWNRSSQRVEDVLSQDEDAASRALAALGNRQRLALLKVILERPSTAGELVERVGSSSSGRTYHNLKTLQAAGLIRQLEDGRFAFVGHQAPAFIVLLSGVWMMLHTRYGTGNWEAAASVHESYEEGGR